MALMAVAIVLGIVFVFELPQGIFRCFRRKKRNRVIREAGNRPGGVLIIRRYGMRMLIKISDCDPGNGLDRTGSIVFGRNHSSRGRLCGDGR